MIINTGKNETNSHEYLESLLEDYFNFKEIYDQELTNEEIIKDFFKIFYELTKDEYTFKTYEEFKTHIKKLLDE